LGRFFQGRPGIFLPSVGQCWRRLTGLSSPSLFERSGLSASLKQLIDFDYLNRGDIRLIINDGRNDRVRTYLRLERNRKHRRQSNGVIRFSRSVSA
jgi:hypothetical protein